MKKLVMVLSMFALLASCGQNSSSESQTASASEVKSALVVVQGFKAEPVNAGINPAHGAVEVSVGFIAGSNSCVAAAYDYAIEQTRVGKVIHIEVKSKLNPLYAFRACTAEYMPVSKNLKTVVRFNVWDDVTIYVDNVKSVGNHVKVKI